jgi:HK97 family phage prohead protease
MKKEKEIRSFDGTIECRKMVSEDKYIIEGYAAIFNTQSEDLGGFREIISRNAFDGVIELSDVFCLLDHNKDKGILGRSRFGKGTLTLSIDDKGLRYEVELPDTELAKELIQYIERGEINQSSFAFRVASDTWTELEDETYLRMIDKFERLFDVSPVFQPAYADTTVAERSLDKFKQELENRQAVENKKEIAEYYNNYKSIIETL